MEYRYAFGAETVVVLVDAAGDGFVVTVLGHAYHVKAQAARAGQMDGHLPITIDQLPSIARPGEIDLEIGGERHCLAYVEAQGASRWVALATGEGRGRTYLLTVPDMSRRQRRGYAAGHEALEAQMPGIVRRVLVAEGQAVTRGQTLLLLEAMKMEIRVTAPMAGVVQRVAVTGGQAVERGQKLVVLASQPALPA